VEPAAAGGIALRKKLMSPSRGFLSKQLLFQRYSRWAIPQSAGAALTGLAGADTDTSSYL